MESSKPKKKPQMDLKYSKNTPIKGMCFKKINEELGQRTKYPQIPSKSKVKALNMKSNKLLSHSLEETTLGMGAYQTWQYLKWDEEAQGH